ncbi:NUDIX domain-containing protein [Prauserella muralis]|uniref:ADP-ribose pyrophosphatase n=1 Tax=Prauserella muralis TaxID=588067 RepID=A0A2V4B4M8_9PSEU|nr:NUDIX domain-containing protein [Prauserella muralis]PXY28045.1 ADP-ribose pyrophosphatase [Prauserella muralis]TWE22160.1 ADP-ribose pyrophosphatase YjhB (NUDIX family) [Prauserella muralis]
MLLGNGDGFVSCACGQRHWGLHGAAGLLLSDPRRGVLLQHRAGWTHHGQTWALPGGAVQPGETPAEAATRETHEETAVPAESVRVLASRSVDHGTWSYTTVLATVRGPVRPRIANAESTAVDWVDPEDVADYPLHRDFAAAWPALKPQLDRELVLVVDAANVMGSRPDGWWRDRAGAAERLRDQLAPLARSGVPAASIGLAHAEGWHWWPRLVLVVEGQARHTAAAGGVEVVAAGHDGDTAIVETARDAVAERPRDHVVVVTADRELRERVRAVGGGVSGPSGLLELLGAGQR